MGVALVEIWARAVAAVTTSTTARTAGFHIGVIVSQRNGAPGKPVSAGERADISDQVPEGAGILEDASVRRHRCAVETGHQRPVHVDRFGAVLEARRVAKIGRPDAEAGLVLQLRRRRSVAVSPLPVTGGAPGALVGLAPAGNRGGIEHRRLR